MAPCAVDRLLLLLLFSAPIAHAVDTCLQPSGLAGLIFGCIFGTVLVCVIVALLLWWLLKSRKPGEKILVIEKPSEHTAYDNRAFDVEDKGVATEGTPPRPRRVKKTRDQESTTVVLKNRDHSGLGFSIHGNMSDGIYVKDLLDYGPAIESGKIFPGDRLMSVAVNFENMVYEDALTILSYATPYTVTLKLQRRVEKGKILTEETDRVALIHPLFRSQSMGETPASPEPKSEVVRSLSLYTAPPRVAETSNFDNRDLSPIVENAQTHRVTVEMEIRPRTPSPPPTSSDDPYSELSVSEKFAVMQLSFEDPVTSVSSPDLYQPLEVDTAEEIEEDMEEEPPTPSPPPPPKPILSRAETTESDSDSLPDVEIIKQQLELNRLELRTPSPPPPPIPTASISVQKFEKSDEGALSPIIHRQLPKLPPAAVSPKPSKEDDADIAMRLYQQRRQMLKPTTERANWAKPTNSDARTEYSETLSALTSPNGSNGVNFFSNSHTPVRRETGMPHANTDPAMRANGAPKRTPLAQEDSLDKEQVTKLMYNQQYLVKQQEELARMGIHVPLHSQLKPIGKGGPMTQSSSVSQIRF